jgi:hypothetical protein
MFPMLSAIAHCAEIFMKKMEMEILSKTGEKTG